MEEEKEVLIVNSFTEITKLKSPSIGEKIVTLDIRNVTGEDRRRILDFITGLALGKRCTIKQINKNGEFLIIPPSD